MKKKILIFGVIITIISLCFVIGFKDSGIFKDSVVKQTKSYNDGAILLPKVSASNESKSSIRLTMTNNDDYVKYIIYRSTSKTKGYVKIGATYQNEFIDTKAVFNKLYYYKVYGYTVDNKRYVSQTIYIRTKLAAPVLSVNSNGYNSLKISWNKSTGATGYKIYYYTKKTGVYKLLKTTTSLSYTHNYITAGRDYYYKVKAYTKINGYYYYSNYSTVKKSSPAMKDMGKITVSRDTLNSLKITFDKVLGATSYEIYRSLTFDGTFEKVNTVSTNSYIDTGLSDYTRYYYKVRAVRAYNGYTTYTSLSEMSSNSTTIAIPNVTVGSSYLAGPVISITVPEVAGLTDIHYYVYDSENVLIPIWSTSYGANYNKTSHFVPRDLKLGEVYYVKVCIDGDNNGTLVQKCSEIKKVTIKPNAPTISTYNSSISSIECTVGNMNTESGTIQEIYRSTSENGKYTKIAELDNSPYSFMTYYDENVKLNTTYYYKARSVKPTANGNVYSDFSEIISKKVYIYNSVFLQVYSRSGGTGLYVYWSSLGDQIKYELYRSTSENGTYSLIKRMNSAGYMDENAELGKTYYYKVLPYFIDNNKRYYGNAETASGLVKLQMPNIFLISPGYKDLTIIYSDSDKATEYIIYRSEEEEGTYEQVGTSTTSSYKDTNLESYKTYYYKVKAKAEINGKTFYSNLSSSSSETTSLKEPSFDVEPINSTSLKIKLREAVDGADKYKYYYKEAEEVEYTLAEETTATEHVFNLERGVSYKFKVVAIDEREGQDDFTSVYSPTNIIIPRLKNPTITVTPYSYNSNKIVITPVEDATSYHVYAINDSAISDEDDQHYFSIDDIGASYYIYTDKNLITGGKYFYVVVAVNGNPEDEVRSDFVESELVSPTLNKTTVTLDNATSGTIKISYDSVEGRTKYQIYRSTSSKGTYKRIATTSYTSYTDKNVTKGKTYYYKVRAYRTVSNQTSYALFSTIKSIKVK